VASLGEATLGGRLFRREHVPQALSEWHCAVRGSTRSDHARPEEIRPTVAAAARYVARRKEKEQ